MTDLRSSRGAAAQAFFYITERSFSTAGSTTRCTHQHVPIRVVAILEKIRADLILTRLEWADLEKGTRVLTSVIVGFETRFGDGSNVCEAKALLANLVATPR